jgi:hypothetical protein
MHVKSAKLWRLQERALRYSTSSAAGKSRRASTALGMQISSGVKAGHKEDEERLDKTNRLRELAFEKRQIAI